MTPPFSRGEASALVTAVMRSAPFGRVLTLAIVGTVASSLAVRSIMGWPGLLGALAALAGIAGVALFVNRHELEWHGLLPVSLLVFLGWSVLSLFWSDYHWVSLQSILYQLIFAFLAVYVALTRDLIQIVRAFGDVLRVLLLVSFALEILSGLLFDMPFGFLGIAGNLDTAGPIQGIFSTRNQLAVVALIAVVTFFIELETHSVPRRLATGSLVLAGLAILFTRSPVAFGSVLVAALAALALLRLRRMAPAERRVRQFVLLGTVVLLTLVGLLFRGRVVRMLNAGSEFELRARLWRSILRLTEVNPVEGFGWTGYWRTNVYPYAAIDPLSPPHATALNAYLDVWLQLGLIGLLSFVALVTLAFVRSWLLASNKRSVVFLWPALVLVVLLLVSGAESSALVEFGWFTLIVCAVKAAQELSWRHRLPET